MASSKLAREIKVADEVFIATALLQRESPNRDDFTIDEIVDRVALENLYGRLRPGVRVHVLQHSVANKKPNPGRWRTLYATGRDTRRLLRSTDEVHPERTWKIWPALEEVPIKFHELIEWAQKQFGTGGKGDDNRWLGGVLALRGLGRGQWKDEDPDAHVDRLRAGWE
jgi:hypothetical protein